MDSQCQLVLGANVLMGQDANVLRSLTVALDAQGHILLKEPAHILDKPETAALVKGAGLVAVARQLTAASEYVLLCHVTTLPATRIVLEVCNDNFAWVETLRDAMKRAESEDLRVYVWSRDADSGVLGLGTSLHHEAGGDKLRVYYLPGPKDVFDPDAPKYRAQVQLDRSINVLRAGVWGSFCHLLLDDLNTSQHQVSRAYHRAIIAGAFD